jgi:hypothetical protein
MEYESVVTFLTSICRDQLGTHSIEIEVDIWVGPSGANPCAKRKHGGARAPGSSTHVVGCFVWAAALMSCLRIASGLLFSPLG